MSLARGKYGIEYDPMRSGRKPPSGFGRIIVVIALLATSSLVWTAVGRFRAHREEARLVKTVVAAAREESRVAVAAQAVRALACATNAPPPLKPIVQSPKVPALDRRSPQLRNLLIRLEAAERLRDIKLAVDTIVTIRGLPGSPAADIDDRLARQLGHLNIRRLFELHDAIWVRQVVAKRGDTASRIASEHGSTFASLQKLNGDKLDRVAIGQRLYVLNHPRFNLVIHRRSRTADLSLNGIFFKRYDLTKPVAAAEGVYETDRQRQHWARLGLSFASTDRQELDLLLPSKTPILVSEM